MSGWRAPAQCVAEKKTQLLRPSSPRGPRVHASGRVAVCELLPGIRTAAKDGHSSGHSALFVRANKSPLVSVTRRWGYYVSITKRKSPAQERGQSSAFFDRMDRRRSLRPLHLGPLMAVHI